MCQSEVRDVWECVCWTGHQQLIQSLFRHPIHTGYFSKKNFLNYLLAFFRIFKLVIFVFVFHLVWFSGFLYMIWNIRLQLHGVSWFVQRPKATWTTFRTKKVEVQGAVRMLVLCFFCLQNTQIWLLAHDDLNWQLQFTKSCAKNWLIDRQRKEEFIAIWKVSFHHCVLIPQLAEVVPAKVLNSLIHQVSPRLFYAQSIYCTLCDWWVKNEGQGWKVMLRHFLQENFGVLWISVW